MANTMVSLFQNSYIITARNQPCSTYYNNIVPLPDGQLWFYTSPNPYDFDACNYKACDPSASVSPPQAFLDLLNADLIIAGVTNQCPQITVLIHGLGNLFFDSIEEMAIAGTGLQAQGYGGLVISFDWPSYSEADSAFHYASSCSPNYSFPPTATQGTVRDNINGTAPAFANLIAALLGVQSAWNADHPSTPLQINFICHSEGNYMMMTGMYYFQQNYLASHSNQLPAQPLFNSVLLVAADISSAALRPQSWDFEAGQAIPIATFTSQVTIYYSSGDDVLPWALEKWGCHFSLFRLGLEGPDWLLEKLVDNACAVDCSNVITDAHTYPQVPPGMSTHSSYFYIPQVLQDWAATLIGTLPAKVANRIQESSPQWFTMTYITPPSVSPKTPEVAVELERIRVLRGAVRL